jgi:hypothetical protein
MERAQSRALAFSVAGEQPAQRDRGRQLAALGMGGPDRGGFGFGDDEHRPSMGEAPPRASLLFQGAMRASIAGWTRAAAAAERAGCGKRRPGDSGDGRTGARTTLGIAAACHIRRLYGRPTALPPATPISRQSPPV